MNRDFRGQSRDAQSAVTRTLGGRVFQSSMIGSLFDTYSRRELEDFVLIIGNRVEREFEGRKYTDFNLQVEFEPERSISLLKFISEVKEDDPRGIITQRDVQRVLGGSDPRDRVDMDPRALRKIQQQEKKWRIDWVGLVPRTTSGLSTVLGQLSAFSLTEQRESREFLHRNRQNGGAFFPFMLKEEFEEETEEQREEREEKERIYECEIPMKWTQRYINFIDKAWQMFDDFGVPGVKEMMAAQFNLYKISFTTFDAEKWTNKWVNDQETNDSFKGTAGIYSNWYKSKHCCLSALEEAVKHQETESASRVLESIIIKLTFNQTFLTKDKIIFGRLTKIFEEFKIPFVINQKVFNSEQKKWKSFKLPKRGWKENEKDPNCVKINLGLWNNEHFFYWKDNVNKEYDIENWPYFIRSKFEETVKNGDNEYTRLPKYSCGKLLQKLVDEDIVVPIRGVYEMYSGCFEEPEKLSLIEELKEIYDHKEEMLECCVPDTNEKLKRKLGVKKIPRQCLFVGDTESFIDPKTGIHKPSLIVIKGIYRDDITIKCGLWENCNPIRQAMKDFVNQYTNWVFSFIKQRVEDIINHKEVEGVDVNQPYIQSLAKYVNNLLPEITKEGKSLSKLKEKYLEKIKGVDELGIDKKLCEPRIYFHNLGYDVQAFLTEFSPSKKEAAIKKGSVWYSMTFKFMGCEFILRNSFTIITTALKNFPKMFLPKEEQDKMKKEVYAYDAVNEELMMMKEPVNKKFIVDKEQLRFAIQKYEIHKNQEQKEQLLEDLWRTATEVNCVEGDLIDMGKYTVYYCERDVDLLAIGLKAWEAIGEQDTTKNTFKGMPPFKKFDVYNFMSAPAIAQSVTEVEVRQGKDIPKDSNEKPLDCTYKYKGRLRKFMLNCTSGGRCTLADEKRQLVDCMKNPRVKELIEKTQKEGEKLSEEEEKYLYQNLIKDFDARSLYPTAMSRASIPLGYPEVVYFGPDSRKDENWLKLMFANGSLPDDAMYIITDITYDIKLAMPTNSWKQEKPEPRCRWNNSVPLGVQQLRKLTDLKTMCRFQRAHFRILGGLEWRHGSVNKIQQFMKDVYAFRVLNHSGGFDHPIQEAAKLIMNSFYGKNVTKIREDEEIFFPARKWYFDEKKNKFKEISGHFDLLSYLKYNWRNIKQVQYLGGCFIVRKKFKDDAAYDVNFGCEVLAGSRAVICPVSALVELITKQPCLYTDTDSLHLYGWQVDAIAPHFKQYFGIDMIGKELGQFHVDFEPRTFKKGETCLGSSFFCGVGKKMYIDELRGSQGSCEFHRRAKGIRAEYLSKEEYLRLYYGETLYKNLDECGAVQIRQRNGHNLSVHITKQVRATAEGEVEVITDLIETEKGDKLIENAAGELLDVADALTEDEDLEEIASRVEKRSREFSSTIEGNEDDTIEMPSDSEEEEPPAKEARIEIV